MRKCVIVLMISLTVFQIGYAQTNFTETVSSLWYAGQKTNVLNIANQRLQTNTNDIAGLILKMEYQIEFLQLNTISNTMQRVLVEGTKITTTNFVTIFSVLEGSVNHLLDMIPLYPPDEFATDQGKCNISGKPLSFRSVIQALENDGYFN